MLTQEKLAQEFVNAINLELQCDNILTDSYLSKYSPKKLASFGLAIVNLTMTNMRSGIGGKSLIELSLDPAVSQPDEEIKSGSLRVGDIVQLDKMKSATAKDSDKESTSLEGVVTRLSSSAVTVSVEEDTSDDNLLNLYNNTGNDHSRMWIVKLTNYITYKRMLQAMKRLETLSEGNKNDVLRILLGEASFVPRKAPKTRTSFFDKSLNDSQKKAIDFAIHTSPVTIVHGPPGTGKTYTLIELIKQLTFNHGERVLVCGASNISVDNILERLSPVFTTEEDTSGKKSRRKASKTSLNNEHLIRIGHPARLLEANHKHSLDVLSKSSASSGSEAGEQRAILRDVEKDISSTLSQIKKSKRYGERKALWGEVKSLRKELRTREQKIVSDLLRNARVILSTLHGAGSNELFHIYKSGEFNMENPFFDTIVIDEVSQSLEPQCWIALATHLGFKRLVIAGDNLQLPATVKSKEEAEKLRKSKKEEPLADLEFTLFDRLMEYHGGADYKKLLDVQYRMNTEIMEFPSETLYDGQLKAADSVKDIILCDLDDVEETEDTQIPCIWYDTQGGDFPERVEDDDGKSVLASTGSKYNDMEASVAVQHIAKLIEAGVKPEEIGVISPYSAQVAVLKKAIQKELQSPGVEVSTIDGFQGREKEAIVVSLVRSNDEREIGFLSDRRRLNVAMTRPKRQLCVIGDMETLERSKDKFLCAWVKYVEEKYEVRYIDAVGL
ncbi:hypothetical protein FT663_00006 [Candidozyma haemuli var. vulneris]|uniref:DNA helicase n=1 Tax=Candidozyma haemuli TaxID=45357 RepID=A0A2V1AVF9_9ASCO|nr:hypothetical protein CXQ85_000796 [[Candida] haemuloni]KAF3993986.1 hypothetical protein FT662_00172 [[Candida] haemuloni var. vulneris]KAF3995783.1 hypothetical protein FT663_00006 [[Candida] haemuloni var. vulneris]PVH21805.1 hypothetical protein CXQ85_000796 [[Candida] haemuloni]